MFTSKLPENYQWHKLAESYQELFADAVNGIRIIEVAGKKITLAFFNDQIFAMAHKCPHSGGILGDGFIDATGNIVCPLHKYRFCIKTGRNISGEGYYLKTWAVETRIDGIYVGF